MKFLTFQEEPMSFFITEYELDKIIEEDVNPIDLTSTLLGMNTANAEISYRSRHDTVVSCTEEVERIFNKLGLTVIEYLPTGTQVQEGEVFFRAKGRGDRIHLAWRNGVRMFESFCGVAQRTKSLVDKAKSQNPDILVATTRKNMPGTKKLVIKSVIAGGAFPHRLGLSETVLIFDAHIELAGGKDAVAAKIPELKKNNKEKKLGIEAHTHEDGILFVKAGCDFIQLDKFSPEETVSFIAEAKKINPELTVVSAGNINVENADVYAQTGTDVLVTSSLYFGKSADIKAVISKID
jgi:molybdenum transport protein